MYSFIEMLLSLFTGGKGGGNTRPDREVLD